MGRRKAKTQTKPLSRGEDESEDNTSLEPGTNDLGGTSGQHLRGGTDRGEANDVAGTVSDDAKQDSEDDQKTQVVKKKEYKGNKLKRIQGIKQKESKLSGGPQDGSPKRVAYKGGSDGDQSDGRDSVEEGDEAAEPDHKAPIEVLYCPSCTFPVGMCEFGGMMDKCRPWLLEHAPEFADADNLGRKRRILTEKEHLEAMLAGKGIKKALEKHVVLEVGNCTGKRKTTSIIGMDLFGFNLKNLSKDWRKIFSCGVGVRKAEERAYQDCINIQGDVLQQLINILLNKYEIPKEAVYHIVNKKKTKYFDDNNAG